jgi:transketolase
VSVRVAVEAAVAQSWYKFIGDTGEIVSIEHYGAYADHKTVFREFGFTPEAVVTAAERTLNRPRSGISGIGSRVGDVASRGSAG